MGRSCFRLGCRLVVIGRSRLRSEALARIRRGLRLPLRLAFSPLFNILAVALRRRANLSLGGPELRIGLHEFDTDVLPGTANRTKAGNPVLSLILGLRISQIEFLPERDGRGQCYQRSMGADRKREGVFPEGLCIQGYAPNSQGNTQN